MKQKKKLIIGIGILLILPLAIALTLTTLSDSTTSTRLIFDTTNLSQNISFNFRSDANITSSFIDLESFLGTVTPTQTKFFDESQTTSWDYGVNQDESHNITITPDDISSNLTLKSYLTPSKATCSGFTEELTTNCVNTVGYKWTCTATSNRISGLNLRKGNGENLTDIYSINPAINFNAPINLKFKITCTWVDPPEMLLCQNSKIYMFSSECSVVSTSHPTNLTIDTGNDGGTDYSNNTLWNGSKVTTTNIDINATAMMDFLSNKSKCNVTLPTTCNITTNITTATVGELNISNINITYTIPTVTINLYNRTPYTPTYDNNVSFWANVSSSAGYNISSCNFTLTAPNTTNVINNENGTVSVINWTSSKYLIPSVTPSIGQWNWSVICTDNTTLTDTQTGNPFNITDNVNPSLIVNNPTSNSTTVNSNVLYNLTSTSDDVELDTCWYNLINYTNGASIQGNTTIACTTETESMPLGTFNSTIYVNDTSGNLNQTTITNITITADTSPPTVTITQPSGAKTSKTVSMSYTITDNVANNNCGYWVELSTGVLHIDNTTLNCSATSNSFTVALDASFIIFVWGNDTNSNLATSNSSFSVESSTSPGEQTGGSPSRPTIPTALLGNITLDPPDGLNKLILNYFSSTKNKTYLTEIESNKPIKKCVITNGATEIDCEISAIDDNILNIIFTATPKDKLVYTLTERLLIETTDGETIFYNVSFQVVNWMYSPFGIPVVLITMGIIILLFGYWVIPKNKK